MRNLDTYLMDNSDYELLLVNPKHLRWFYKAYKSETYKVCTAIIKEIFLPLDKKIITLGSNPSIVREIVSNIGDESLYEKIYNINTNTFSINFDDDSLFLPILDNNVFYIKDFVDRQGKPILHNFLKRLIAESLLLSPLNGKNQSSYLEKVKYRIQFCLKKDFSMNNFSYFYEAYLLKEVISKTKITDPLTLSLVFNDVWIEVEKLFLLIENVRFHCLENEDVITRHMLDTINSKYQMENFLRLMDNHPILKRISESIIP